MPVDPSIEKYDMLSLKDEYGKKKIFIPEYEKASLIALSFYPELKNTRVTFMYADEVSSGKCTIAFSTVFNNRNYLIYINNNKKKTGMLLSEAPFNAQVGIIAHELSHVVDFKKKNVFQLIGWAISYLIRNKRIEIERNTDILTIKHGAGTQLYEWSQFLLNNPNISNDYKKARNTYYLQPNEILELIK
jgi:hypothetical protein